MVIWGCFLLTIFLIALDTLKSERNLYKNPIRYNMQRCIKNPVEHLRWNISIGDVLLGSKYSSFMVKLPLVIILKNDLFWLNYVFKHIIKVCKSYWIVHLCTVDGKFSYIFCLSKIQITVKFQRLRESCLQLNYDLLPNVIPDICRKLEIKALDLFVACCAKFVQS